MVAALLCRVLPSPTLPAASGQRLLSAFTTSQQNAATTVDLSSDESRRRLLLNRLVYRSKQKQRGFLELDLVLGTWVEQHVHSMDESNIRAAPSCKCSTSLVIVRGLNWVASVCAIHLLIVIYGIISLLHILYTVWIRIFFLLGFMNTNENPDLWKWLTGQEQPPEDLNSNPVFTAIKSKVTDNLSKHASPETRSTPGQPWVRGWDDIKKGCSACCSWTSSLQTLTRSLISFIPLPREANSPRPYIDAGDPDPFRCVCVTS
uniref:Uncharacterized protein n=2 Tax=Setaria italica TaxID=4555 RepID=K3ZNP0_SETIT